MRFLIFAILLIVGTVYGDPCSYVMSGTYLTDPTTVKECFNTYKIPSGVVDTLIAQLDRVSDVYVYKDIFKNLPPPGNQKPLPNVDFDELLKQTKEELRQSNGVISKIFRALRKFSCSFHDVHFDFSLIEQNNVQYIFDKVFAFVPFLWDLVPDQSRNEVIFIEPYALTQQLYPDLYNALTELLTSGAYAVSVDGINAKDFFTDFLTGYDNMKTVQGQYMINNYRSFNGASLFSYPLNDTMLSEHTIVFSNKKEVKFNTTFLNMAKALPSQEHKLVGKELWGSPLTDSINSMKGLNNLKRSKKNNGISKSPFIDCQASDVVDYMIITAFPQEAQAEEFLRDLQTCVNAFDNNAAPIVVHVPANVGGFALTAEMVQFFLMPNRAIGSPSAVRKTQSTKYISLDAGQVFYMYNINDTKCTQLDAKSGAEWWKKEVVDDYGNNVKHVRTDKILFSSAQSLASLGPLVMKNPRKPTDIVILTDGYCISACSYFLNNIAETGGAIIAGYGPYNSKNELFAHSQYPSHCLTPGFIFKDLVKDVSKYGIAVVSTFAETYPLSASWNETIPRDFTTGNIDVNSHLYSVVPNAAAAMKAAYQVHQDYQTKCNKDNKRLMMLDANCKATDPNALEMGHICGADGKWDNTKCFVSTCKPGYMVDFDTNTCVAQPCDVRVLKGKQSH